MYWSACVSRLYETVSADGALALTGVGMGQISTEHKRIRM
jgi:hypothetical protein